MSSKEVSLRLISLRQYFYKLKAFSNLINRLLLAQLLALLFSLGGTGMMSSGNGEVTISIRDYSANMMIIFSFLWIFVVAILLTTKQYKKMEIPLVTNRISGNLSDIGFLLTASIFAGVTSSLAGVLLRVVVYFTFDRSQIVFGGFSITVSALLLGMVVGILYMVLIAGFGYLLGVLSQINVSFVIIIPIMAFGVVRVYTHFAQSAFNFIAAETSLPRFALKILVISLALFGCSALLSQRMEASK